jgi:hypothetical protein
VPARAVVPARPVIAQHGTAPRQTTTVTRVRHERIMTLRVAFFVLLLIGVLGGAAGFVGWFVRASYFVGVVDGRVAILEGRPGGFLWFKPTVVERTSLAESSVFPPTRPYLRAGMEESSLAAARDVVAELARGTTYLDLPTASTQQADGVPTGSTLVPLSTAATVPLPAASQPEPAGVAGTVPTTTAVISPNTGTTPRAGAGRT